MSREMSEFMKRAYELAPFVAEAIRETADEATFPADDERNWTQTEQHSRQFAVDLAETLLSDNAELFGSLLIDEVMKRAEALRDEQLE